MSPVFCPPSPIEPAVVTLVGAQFHTPIDVRSAEVQALFLVGKNARSISSAALLDLVPDNERSALLTTIGRLQLFGWVTNGTHGLSLTQKGLEVRMTVEQAYPEAGTWAHEALQSSWQRHHDKMLQPFKVDASLAPVLRSLDSAATRGTSFLVHSPEPFPQPGQILGMQFLLRDCFFGAPHDGYARAYTALQRLQELGFASFFHGASGLEARITSYGRRALAALNGNSP